MNAVRLSPLGENRFPDIPGLGFYETQDGLLYFDATRYLAGPGQGHGLSVDDFFARFDYLVGTLCEALGVERDSLTVNDGKGDSVYLDECLVIPFLMYAERRFGPWMFLRMEELLRLGFTVNDSMADYFYATRFADNTQTELR